MGGEVTVYSGWLGAGLAAAGGMSGISLKLSPGIEGICIPLIGGIPPIIEDMSLLIMEEEELEKEEEELLEKEEDPMEDMLDDMFPMPMSMPPILDIILLIMSSMPRDFMSPPIMLGIPPMLIIPPGMGPPEDIIVEEEEEEELDLKLEIVEPSSDWVVAAMLWLLALSSFLTATPSSVTKAWLWAFMASETWAPSGAEMTRGAEMVRIPAPE